MGTDDWMDGEIIGTMEDEDEYIEEAEHENVVDIIKEPIMEIHTSFKDIETHMCKGQTDVVNSNMKKNTKETDENIETIGATDSAVKFTEQINSTKNIIKNIETEHHGFNLPVNEVTDDWMNDDLFGTFDKNSENEWLKEKDINIGNKENKNNEDSFEESEFSNEELFGTFEKDIESKKEMGNFMEKEVKKNRKKKGNEVKNQFDQ